MRASLDTVAGALGISAEDLRSESAKGQSIADIAKSKHVDVSTVVDALVKDATSKIDAAEKAGHLTQDRAAKLKSGLEEIITKAVNSTHSFSGGGRFGHGGRFGRGHGPRPIDEAPMPFR